MNLGLIVLADNNEELLNIIAKLQGEKVAPLETSTKTEAASTSDADLDDDFAEEAQTEELHVPTAEELKTVLTQVRDEQGVDMLKEILTSFGATNLKTLDKSDWPSAYASAKAALGANTMDDDLDDGLDDDLDDDFDGGEAPDAEAVKTACQAYAKVHGKEKATDALKAAGLNSVRGLKSSTDEQRIKLMKLVS